MPPHIIASARFSKTFGERVVLREINLSFYYGAKIGLVGENGAGKSTLLKIMAGLDKDIDGTATLAKGMRVRYVAQEPLMDLEKTVREHLDLAVRPVQAMVDRFNAVAAKMADPGEEANFEKLMDQMGRLQEQIDAAAGWELDRLIEIASNALVLPPDDAVIKQLSGGERRRVALCMALLEKPDLLLLDEPTNHLDAETAEWLEQALREYHGTVIIATHDRYFLDNITKWILEIDGGRGLPFEGNYSCWLAQKAELLRILEKKETQRQKTLQRELDWIRNSHEGRKQKNQARIKAYEQLASGQTLDARSESLIQIAPAARLGERMLEVKNLRKGFQVEGQYLNLIEDCSFNVPRGAIVGVIGPNGTGKTTLFRMITGEEKPDAGTIELGPSVVLSYVDQHRDALDDSKTIFEEITDGKDTIELGKTTVNSRVYVGRFNFRGSQQQKKVGECSGGERNRIHLAKMLRRGGNLLLLDEPTNDLDVATMRVLEQGLIDFAGFALVISHDRFFLDRIATHLLVMEANGKTRWFEGNFADYERAVTAEDPNRAVHRRGKYKRLALR